jgi:hypothetical protein
VVRKGEAGQRATGLAPLRFHTLAASPPIFRLSEIRGVLALPPLHRAWPVPSLNQQSVLAQFR